MTPFAQTLTTVVVSVVVAVIGSTGFWSWLSHRREKKSAQALMLMALGHDRIMALSTKYVERGYITADEYENLLGLYEPYAEMGGNGSGSRMVEACKALPIKKEEGEKQ